MEHKKVTRPQLMAACGVSAEAVSKWLLGKSDNLKANHAFTIAKLCGVNAEWLATGKGKPYPNPVQNMVGPLIEPKHLDLIRMYRRLPPEARLPVRQLIEVLAAAHRERYATWLKDSHEEPTDV